ncbi:hypothetical protein J6590_059062 [Homalodisca vitripennis]|nr:hypothetical protein J6590_059062 [Homalodisca vitripennis]
MTRKAMLVLDNASTHSMAKKLKDKDIKAAVLLPNVTAFCHAFKKIDMLDEVRWVAEGWEEDGKTPMSLVSSWKVLLENDYNKFKEIDREELKENEVDKENIVSMLQTRPGCNKVNENDFDE